MINEDIKTFLPQYLSPDKMDKLLSDLNQFPENIDYRMFGFEGIEDDIIYQGDGIDNLLIVNLPDLNKSINGNVLILSNTCDIDVSNKRKYDSHLVYAPIVSLEKYKLGLERKEVYKKTDLNNHINDIRKQRPTSIFYLPEYGENFKESLVFLDRIISIPNNYYKRSEIKKHRLFSLSQYGHYLFLFKLSIHFTRFHEKIDRAY